MKKVYLFLIVVILIVIIATGVFVFYSNNKLAKQELLQNSQPELLAETKSIKEENDFFGIFVEYPQFKLADSDFNKKIEDLVKNSLEDFKKNSQDNFKAINDTMPAGEKKSEYPELPFSFDCGWDEVQSNQDYISFVLSIYSFSGGAHGASAVFGFNYDVKNKKEITIESLLDNSQANLEKLVTIARKITYDQLKSQEAFAQDMAEQGTAPVFENYKNFNFDQNNLIIYFQRYQVSFGAAGEITIKIPYSELEKAGLKLTSGK